MSDNGLLEQGIVLFACFFCDFKIFWSTVLNSITFYKKIKHLLFCLKSSEIYNEKRQCRLLCSDVIIWKASTLKSYSYDILMTKYVYAKYEWWCSRISLLKSLHEMHIKCPYLMNMEKSGPSSDSADSCRLNRAGVPWGTGGGSFIDRNVSKFSSAPKPVILDSPLSAVTAPHTGIKHLFQQLRPYVTYTLVAFMNLV